MAEHNHNKTLTLAEQMEASTLRLSLVEAVYRFDIDYGLFRRSHNSGYCAYEVLLKLSEMQRQLTTIKHLLNDLGEVEHYNFEKALAQAEPPLRTGDDWLAARLQKGEVDE